MSVKARVAAYEQKMKERVTFPQGISPRPAVTSYSHVRSNKYEDTSTATTITSSSATISTKAKDYTWIENLNLNKNSPPSSNEKTGSPNTVASSEKVVLPGMGELVGTQVSFPDDSDCNVSGAASTSTASHNNECSWMDRTFTAEIQEECEANNDSEAKLMEAIDEVISKSTTDSVNSEEKKTENSATFDDAIDDSLEHSNKNVTGNKSEAPKPSGKQWENLTEEGKRALQDLERVLFFTDVVDRNPAPSDSFAIIPHKTSLSTDMLMPALSMFKSTEFDLEKVYSDVFDSSLGAYKEVEKSCKEMERTLFFTDLPDTSQRVKHAKPEKSSPLGSEDRPKVSPLSPPARAEKTDSVTQEVDELQLKMSESSRMRAASNKSGRDSVNKAVQWELNHTWKTLEKNLFFTNLDDETIKRECTLDALAAAQQKRTGNAHVNSNLSMCSDFARNFCFTDINGEGRRLFHNKAKNRLTDQVMTEETAMFHLPEELQVRLQARMEQVRQMQQASSSSTSQEEPSTSSNNKGGLAPVETFPSDEDAELAESQTINDPSGKYITAKMMSTPSQEGIDCVLLDTVPSLESILLDELNVNSTMGSPLVTLETEVSWEDAGGDGTESEASADELKEAEEAPYGVNNAEEQGMDNVKSALTEDTEEETEDVTPHDTPDPEHSEVGAPMQSWNTQDEQNLEKVINGFFSCSMTEKDKENPVEDDDDGSSEHKLRRIAVVRTQESFYDAPEASMSGTGADGNPVPAPEQASATATSPFDELLSEIKHLETVIESDLQRSHKILFKNQQDRAATQASPATEQN